jgi:peptidyl-prolyl cis-trans isomerase A (cyclophilin A)
MMKPVATVPVSPDDPVKGVWSLDDATKGLAKEGKLLATIDTEKGKLECELWDDRAPLTVANFVGLARGLRPWKDPNGSWVKKPLYDGTVFHRIIKGFMIQGGDPKGNGSGDTGYVVPDEIWEGSLHNERGLLCMANRGPNTNSAQFFILDAAASYLDGKYTIFGKCSPDKVIETLAGHKVVGDRAVDPPKIKKVTITRRK